MGIPSLWETLQPFGKDVALPRLCDHFDDDRKEVRIGVDVSLWILHGRRMNRYNAKTKTMRTIYYRLCKLLALPGIVPTFVFDGPQRPAWKRGKKLDGDTWSESDISRMAGKVKAFIRAFGFTYVDAPGEAEAELGAMCRHGMLDAVLSDDADCFAFGASVVVRNWSSTLTGNKARSEWQRIELERGRERSGSSSLSHSESERSEETSVETSEEVLERTALQKKENLVTAFHAHHFPKGLDERSGAILVALLSGGDYHEAGMPKCGIKTAIGLVKAGFGASLMKGALEHLQHDQNDPTGMPLVRAGWKPFINRWREELLEEIRTNASEWMTNKQPKLAAASSSKQFLTSDDSLTVLASYIWPVVSSERAAETDEGQNKGIDIPDIAHALAKHLYWTQDGIQASLRNSVWPAVLARHLAGEPVEGLSFIFCQTKKIAHASQARSIVSLLHSTGQKDVDKQVQSAELGPSIRILKERKHPTTGMMAEVFVEFEVSQLVALAQRGAEKTEPQRQHFSQRATSPPSACTPASSQQWTATGNGYSPRKQRKPIDLSKPLRAWVPRSALERNEKGKAALDSFEEEEKQRMSKVVQKKTEQSLKRQQPTLSSFFSRSTPKPKPLAIDRASCSDVSKVKIQAQLAHVVKSADRSPSKRHTTSSPRSSTDASGRIPRSPSKKAKEVERQAHSRLLTQSLVGKTASENVVKRQGRTRIGDTSCVTLSDDSDEDV